MTNHKAFYVVSGHSGDTGWIIWQWVLEATSAEHAHDRALAMTADYPEIAMLTVETTEPRQFTQDENLTEVQP